MKNKFLLFQLLLLLVFSSTIGYSQNLEKEKVFFTGQMSQKYKSPLEYVLSIGYIAAVDRDVYFEFTGGPSKSNLSETIPVKAGRGKFSLKLGGEELPSPGKGYKVLIALREKGGNQKTTKSLTIINNIELVDGAVPVSNYASFSNKTPTDLVAETTITFAIDYNFIDENQVQVSIWNVSVLISKSETITVPAGTATKEISVPFPSKAEDGSNYRFVLNFGTEKEFRGNTTKSEEIVGVTINLPLVFSMDDITNKCNPLDLPKSNTLELPGDPIYKTIKIIDKKGNTVKEVHNTNLVNVISLSPDTYYVVTNSGYYFKFNKEF